VVENNVREGRVVPGKKGKDERRTRHRSLLQSLQESDSGALVGMCVSTPSDDKAIAIWRPGRNSVRCAGDKAIPFTEAIEDLLSRADQGQAAFESFRFISGFSEG